MTKPFLFLAKSFNAIKHVCLILLLVAGLAKAQAQYHAARSYTSRDGLVSSELHTVLVDRAGRVWAGSAQGVSCYNGRAFRNFTIREGLWYNGVQNILEDREGNIWFSHTDSPETEFKVSLWKNGRIEILDIKGQTGLTQGRLFWNPASREVQVFGRGELWAWDPAGQSFALKGALPPEWRQPDGHSIFADPFRDRFFFHRLREGPVFEQEVWIWENGRLHKTTSFYLQSYPEIQNITATPEGRLLLFVNHQLYFLENDQSWRPFSANRTISDISGFPFSDRAVITWEQRDDGTVTLTEINPHSPDGVSLTFRTPHPVSGVSRAPDGSYWVATRGALIRVFPALWDLTADQTGSPWLSDLHAICEDRQGNIWFGSYTFGFSFFDGKSLRRAPPLLNPTSKVLPGAMRDDNGYMHFWVEGTTRGDFLRGQLIFNGTDPPLPPGPDSILGYYFHRAYDGQIGLGLSAHGLGIVAPRPGCPDCIDLIGPEKGHRLTNVITTVKDRYGRWWMGRPSTGFAYYDPARDTVFTWLRTNLQKDIGIMSSLMDRRGNLWLGTTHGLRFFRNREQIDPDTFDPRQEFLPVGLREMGPSQVNALTLYDPNTLIAGNQDGIALIDLAAFYETGQPLVFFLDQNDGYNGLGTEQNCIWTDSRGRVWIGSDAGAHRFDPRLFSRSQKAPAFTMDSLTYGPETFSLRDYQGESLQLKKARYSPRLLLHLSPEQDPIRPDHLYFSYQLSGDSSFSAPAKSSVIEFPNLGAGRYTLRVKALKDGRESAVRTLHFRIPPGTWATPWPYLILLSLSGTGLWAYQKRRQREELEKNRLQISAIVNQLNPHFINNALQWVQIRVYEDKEAVGVLAKLGDNIRMVFRNSREKKAFHALSDEFRLVENYLHIQKQRFGDHLTFELPAPSEIKAFAKIKVPLMQLQIHCENAIEHGILNKEEPGFMRVEIEDKQEYLHFTVEDNGVGRQRAAEIGSKGTQRGTRMLQSLAAIFNKHNPTPLYSQYEDLIFTDESGNRYGTRVHIWIPKNYRYEIR